MFQPCPAAWDPPLPPCAKVSFGSSTDLTAPKFDFRSSTESGLKSDIGPCPVRATSGSEAARNHLCDGERYLFSHCWMKFRITAKARSGASGIAGNKETVRTERGAEAAPQ